MDREMLLKALENMGFKREQLSVHDEAQHLYGYQGDKRAQTAEVIIPRRFVGGAANDIGFKRQEDGTFEAIISEFDSSSGFAAQKSEHAKGCNGYDKLWLERLNRQYAYNKVKSDLEAHNFFLDAESVNENGEIVIEASSFIA